MFNLSFCAHGLGALCHKWIGWIGLDWMDWILLGKQVFLEHLATISQLQFRCKDIKPTGVSSLVRLYNWLVAKYLEATCM